MKFSKKNLVGKVIYARRRCHLLQEETGTKFKLKENELKKVFPGDEVIFSLSENSWAKIESIRKSNTLSLIAKIQKKSKKWTAIPLDYGKKFEIDLLDEDLKDSIENCFAKVIICTQPKKSSKATAKIEKIISSSDVVDKANDLAIIKHNLEESWDPKISEETKLLDSKKYQKISHSRVDLRQKNFVTIDGRSAKDFDDAVYAEKNNNGNFNLYVAIADVSHFVEPNSILDKEARKRGTSIYFHKKVIPMLPEVISNGLCSLKPNEDRLVLVAKIEIESEGKLIEAEFFEAIINSNARLVYEDIQKELERENKPYFHSLKILNKIYGILKKEKNLRGALELDIPQYIPIVKGKKIQRFISPSRTKAHLMIEECMLLANICAAEVLIKYQVPGIFRIHPKPESEKIERLKNFLNTKNINIAVPSIINVKSLTKIVNNFKDKEDESIIHLQVLQTLSLAKYETNVSEHFALGYPSYTHFTSPIRRYPDLIVHRSLKALIRNSTSNRLSLSKNQTDTLVKEKNPFNKDELEEIAIHSSHQERLAEKATRDALKTLKCECASSNIGKEFKGVIQAVTNFGLFIILDDLNIEGLCHIRFLPKKGYYSFDEKSQTLESNKSGHKYSLGDKLRVRIKKVDIISQMIDLEIL